MSLIKDYMSDRRHKKLEEINQALEQLKHENVATDALKPKSTLTTPVSHAPMHTGKDLLFIGILLVCVIVLIVTSFYYRSQYATLNDNYQEKVDKLAELEVNLQEKLDALETAEGKLKDKEASEETLQEERDRLESDVEDLELEIERLEDDIRIKRADVDNLTRTINQQRNEINQQRNEIDRWKDCIEDELDQNLSVCD